MPRLAFYEPEAINGQFNMTDGPIKTFTLRGIKDSPPCPHGGRLLTLEDTVEYFNLVLSLDLSASEKEALVTYMLQLQTGELRASGLQVRAPRARPPGVASSSFAGAAAIVASRALRAPAARCPAPMLWRARCAADALPSAS